jgi:hypothetical protein
MVREKDLNYVITLKTSNKAVGRGFGLSRFWLAQRFTAAVGAF